MKYTIHLNTMESLCEAFSTLTTFTEKLDTCMEHDVQLLMNAYHETMPSIHTVSLESLKLPHYISHSLETKHYFFNKFNTEMDFYKHLEKQIFQHLSTIYFMEIIPLIDEYIEHIYNLR